MFNRAQNSASLSALDFGKTSRQSSSHKFSGDRRKHKRQHIRQTSLSTHPSLFAFGTAWVALDFCVCVIAAAQLEIGTAPVTTHSISSWLLIGSPYALLVLVMASMSGLYGCGASASTFVTLMRIVQGVLPAAVGISLLQRLWSAKGIPVPVIAGEIALTTGAMFGTRLIWSRHRDHLYKSHIAQRNFIIVGADEVGRDVRAYLSTLRHVGYQFHGFVSMCEPTDNLRAVSDDEIVGKIHDVIELAQRKFVDEIIFSRRPATPGVLSGILREAQPLGISIRLIPSLTETLIDRTDLEYVGDLPTIAVFLPRERPMALLLKRVFDVSVAGAALVLLLPLFLVIAIVTKLQSPGPVLYLSKRVGHKGRLFTCFKFRTMVVNAAAMREMLEHRNERKGGAFFKITNDPRVTPVGRVLRKYSMDELPQLWNVVRGDMSLVGPRPPLDSEAVHYNLEHMRRLDAVPGITGLWQVEARRDPSFEKTVYLDRRYINNWSLLLDLQILLQTFKAVVRGTGS